MSFGQKPERENFPLAKVGENLVNKSTGEVIRELPDPRAPLGTPLNDCSISTVPTAEKRKHEWVSINDLPMSVDDYKLHGKAPQPFRAHVPDIVRGAPLRHYPLTEDEKRVTTQRYDLIIRGRYRWMYVVSAQSIATLLPYCARADIHSFIWIIVDVWSGMVEYNSFMADTNTQLHRLRDEMEAMDQAEAIARQQREATGRNLGMFGFMSN